MTRLSLLLLTPFLAGCNLDDLINPGKASQEAHAYRASITAPTATITPQPTQVAEMPVPAAVDVPEPVYVAPEPPPPYVPPPECTYSLYMIFDCIDGKVRML